MNPGLRNFFLAAGSILILTLILAVVAVGSMREVAMIELAAQWVTRLIGLSVVVAVVVEFFFTACDRKETSSKRMAWWVTVALLGLMVTHPHWVIGLAILAIVVSLVLVDGFGRDGRAGGESTVPPNEA